MIMKFFRCLTLSLLGLGLAIGMVEVGVRFAGLVDFPTYTVDNEIGYIIKPNQSGSFLEKNRWAFNDKSMGTSSAWSPTNHVNVLLIGNSIIMGGNPYDQPDKVGPQIQQILGESYAIWPIAVGGWSNVNETIYLERNEDVVRAADFFVWEYMDGGLSGLSTWRNDYVWPRERPIWAGWYVFRRYVLPHLISTNMNELPPEGSVNPNYLKNFEAIVATLANKSPKQTHGIIFFYPSKAEYLNAKKGGDWLEDREDFEKISQQYGIKLIDISQQPDWNESLYRPDGTHLTVEGNSVLAHILSSAITNALTQ
jgi:hypothetical protein